MRRLFIIRKDLNLSAGKLAAMVAHCAEGYWTRLISKNSIADGDVYQVTFELDSKTMEEYIQGLFVKTICEEMGFDSLSYQSLDGMLEAIGIDREKICTYCWNGKE